MLADAGPGKVTPSLTRTVTSTHTRTAPRKSHRSIRGVMPAQHTRTTQGRVRPSRVRHAARLDAPRQVPAPSPQRWGEGGEGKGKGEEGRTCARQPLVPRSTHAYLILTSHVATSSLWLPQHSAIHVRWKRWFYLRPTEKINIKICRRQLGR